MRKPISSDLRERIVRGIENGCIASVDGDTVVADNAALGGHGPLTQMQAAGSEEKPPCT